MAEAVKKLTIFDLQAKVDRGEKVFQVTAVYFPTAQLVDRAGIDCILIGDSLGMTALGYASTVPVTMDETIHHVKAISRAATRSIVVGDLPLGAYHASAADAINSAMRMLKEGGTDVVKIEGGEDFAPIAQAVVKAGIPVMAHIGLTPQLISKLGGFKVQGKDAGAGVQLLKDALAMENAGCFAIVLEAIPDRVAQLITQRIEGHPRIELRREEVKAIPQEPCIIASGPLTADDLANDIARLAGQQHLYFYDAIAPIVEAGSIDMTIAFRQSRYDRAGDEAGEGDYLNCPFTKEEYDTFVDALVAAERIQLRDFEREEARFFEGCLPIEVLARRGHDALAFGPDRPRARGDPPGS